jgi:8-oxo-dGTP diphosphatase
MGAFYLASCIITDDKGRILLLHRNKGDHVQWEIPGGKIDPGENPKATAEREAQEELGVDVDIVGVLGDKHCTEELSNGTFTNHFTWYKAKIVDGHTPKVMEPHTFDDLDYFAIEDLSKMKTGISAAARDLVVEVVAGRIKL